ncbi:type I glyceraldehyde-3-phosphate dehydrogenase [Kurthia huakuii]|uniref:type I glyceraldehyde-3-phosphate dehydrogenase n=1 Tax=Kurthia huakuii TaxID=1421019 RepID=UPI0004977AEA|nr:type I glyceraldehyde-3-phosphate dehydrogenase [Kurthia huakuii]MBM7701006.1 glyceraldehyde 3-phosphate dehydrogenase [Kurthia huakuii]
MTFKLAINGFGRIGRLVFRTALQREDIEIVAVNDLTDAAMLAHLLKYDSVHGKLDADVTSEGENLVVNGKKVRVYAETDPAKLPWGDLDVDIVVESTGRFTNYNDAKKHVDAGAKKVIVSAPGQNMPTFVMGVNENNYNKDEDIVFSNASCTTNCLAPVVKVLDEKFGIKRGMMTTVHSYTNDQKILDLPHKDYRRARAAAMSSIPTTTGAASAVAKVLPQLEGKLDGMAIRVPTPNVSLVDLVAELDKNVTVEELNAAFKAATEEGSLAGKLSYSEEPLVSIDYNGNTSSSTVDALSTMVLEDNMVKVLAWYDNETGYSTRVVDLAEYVAKQGF